MNSANLHTAQITTLLGVITMLFNLILFIIIFCLYCSLVPTKPQAATESLQSFDTFIPSVREAFSSAFDPDPEPSTPKVLPSPILYLPPTKPRRSNQVQPVINEVIIPTQTNPSPSISSEATYQELKQFVKHHNLQQMVKNSTGKPYHKCPKTELIKALTA
ncbi:MAG: hypothetical protein AAGF26_01640 [Cyanobacteria bacterium P01_G01_bin.49]